MDSAFAGSRRATLFAAVRVALRRPTTGWGGDLGEVTVWSVRDGRCLASFPVFWGLGGHRLVALARGPVRVVTAAYHVHGLAGYDSRGALVWHRRDLKKVQTLATGRLDGLESVAVGMESLSSRSACSTLPSPMTPLPSRRRLGSSAAFRSRANLSGNTDSVRPTRSRSPGTMSWVCGSQWLGAGRCSTSIPGDASFVERRSCCPGIDASRRPETSWSTRGAGSSTWRERGLASSSPRTVEALRGRPAPGARSRSRGRDRALRISPAC